MEASAQARIFRLGEAEAVSFGPLSQYHRMAGDDGPPIVTGLQTCAPGDATQRHSHT